MRRCARTSSATTSCTERRQPSRPLGPLPADRADQGHEHEERKRRDDPAGAVPDVVEVYEPEPERQYKQRSARDEQHTDARQPEQERDLGRPPAPAGDLERDSGDDDAADEQERPQQMEEERPAVG